MNILKFFIALLLFGCAPTTVELIEDAHRTGDWSRVESRWEQSRDVKRNVAVDAKMI